jgi:hypothetical protein
MIDFPIIHDGIRFALKSAGTLLSYSKNPPFPLLPLPRQIGGVQVFAETKEAFDFATSMIKQGDFWKRKFLCFVNFMEIPKKMEGTLRITVNKIQVDSQVKILNMSQSKKMGLIEIEPSFSQNLRLLDIIETHIRHGLSGKIIQENDLPLLFCSAIHAMGVKAYSPPNQIFLDQLKMMNWKYQTPENVISHKHQESTITKSDVPISGRKGKKVLDLYDLYL